MRGLPGSLALLLLCGCPKTRVPDPGATDPSLARYGLVKPDAELVPGADIAPVRMSRDADRAREDAARGFGWTVWRVVAVGDEWAEVESVPLPDDGVFCRAPPPSLRGLKLHLWVPVSALGRVTGKPVSKDYGDGTGFELSAGLPVVDQPDGNGVFVQLDGMRLALPHPPPGTDVTFSAAPVIEPAGGEVVYPRTDTWLPLGDAALQVGELAGTLWLEEDLGDGVLTVVTECARFRLRGVDTGGLGLAGGLGRAPRVSALSFLRAGAAVYWTDGREAGTVVRDRPVDWEVEPMRNRRCFDVDLARWRPEGERPPPEEALRICVAEDDVVENEF